MMKLVSSVSLVCGFHGGDPLLIKEYIEVAAETGCSVGAHPSFPDRAGFGDRYIEIPLGRSKRSSSTSWALWRGY